MKTLDHDHKAAPKWRSVALREAAVLCERVKRSGHDAAVGVVGAWSDNRSLYLPLQRWRRNEDQDIDGLAAALRRDDESLPDLARLSVSALDADPDALLLAVVLLTGLDGGAPTLSAEDGQSTACILAHFGADDLAFMPGDMSSDGSLYLPREVLATHEVEDADTRHIEPPVVTHSQTGEEGPIPTYDVLIALTGRRDTA